MRRSPALCLVPRRAEMFGAAAPGSVRPSSRRPRRRRICRCPRRLQKLGLRSWLRRNRCPGRWRHCSHAAHQGGVAGVAGKPVVPETDWSPMVRSICRVDPSCIRLGIGRCWLLRLPFPDEVFPLCILQHLGQLGIAAVVGQDEDYLRIRPGIGVRDRVVRRQPLPPIRPRLRTWREKHLS